MSQAREFRDLGMHRRIARRDFLNGVALTVGAASLDAASVAGLARTQAPGSDAAYPPRRVGLRGQHASALASFDRLKSDEFAAYPRIDADTGETYDLVVVGGGLSGLAAAYFWHSALPNQRVLVLDNHDDFGGHAKRNEFVYEGRTYLGYGGTMSVATPYPYSYMAKRLLVDLGIEVARAPEFLDRDLFEKYKLGPSTFFDKEHFGQDRLVVGTGRLPWDQFFSKAPLSDAARRDLTRIFGRNPDYLAGKTTAQKEALLARISYQEFLLAHARMSPDALPYFLGQGGRNNKRVDTMPALEAARAGRVGFDGLGLDLEEGFREGSFTIHFPDGNATIARLLVSRLVPGAIAGTHDMQSILKAPVAYDRLDAAATPTRVRLNSTVVRVGVDGPAAHPTGARVAYLRDGKMHQVHAKSVVLACYNSLVPRLLPELPDSQKEALAYSVKVPMLYTNVLIRRWTPFKDLGVTSISAPGMYYPNTSLDAASKVGGYKAVTTPDEPIVVHMVRNPNKPGLPRKEQHRAGQRELLTMTFQEHELTIRRQMARMLAGTDFDPAADIVGVAVNRWPDGYAYTYDTLADPDVPPEQRPHVIGRARFGPVAIANSDAGAAAFTNQAFDEAHRAVQELLVSRGLA
ncbi:MAG: NAD(P)-binding protein [Vicinamibacterales bacterium]